MTVTSNNPGGDYRDDLAALLAGELPQSRVREILAAAERDPALARVLAEHKSLDRLLNFYEVPEPSNQLRKEFWARFHNDKLLGSTGMMSVGRSSRLWLKLVGPIAAALVITLGIIFWPKPTGPVIVDNTPVAENPAPEETEFDDDEFDRIILGAQPDEPVTGTDLFRRLKQLDDPRLAVLDNLDPDDFKLMDDLELLSELESEEGN
ncbi:MAG: hypothetical protein IT462_00470 [Planctomycetes bacterium]|nr:hypothetical protein [Planctomycetota bacterium]